VFNSNETDSRRTAGARPAFYASRRKLSQADPVRLADSSGRIKRRLPYHLTI
jgi:hypothetical protein